MFKMLFINILSHYYPVMKFYLVYYINCKVTSEWVKTWPGLSILFCKLKFKTYLENELLHMCGKRGDDEKIILTNK